MTIEEQRCKLHEKLCDILGNHRVYYDPPNGTELEYPAIIYNKSRIRPLWANNRLYIGMVAYTVTLIRQDDDDDMLDKLIAMPYTSFDRQFTSNNLHHDVVTTFI